VREREREHTVERREERSRQTTTTSPLSLITHKAKIV